MATRPSGTPALLFTAIVARTRLWEHDPAQMPAAVQRHGAILRQAIAAHGGYADKLSGDAFQAALFTAPAALAVQQALAATPWGALGPLRVRMAVHSGCVEERGDDYVGPLLNRLARLLAAGYGGQTLLTEATRALVCDALPPAVSLHDLAAHRLKDLLRPEHVFQVLAPGLPATFQPLRTQATERHNLPVQRSPLLGPVQAVARLTALLGRDTVSLLHLTGPGGGGKTRFAPHVAAELRDHIVDSVRLVVLAPIRAATVVATTMARSLGLRETGGHALSETLTTYVRGKHLLPVVDSFEQVEAASPIAALLASAPRLTNARHAHSS